MEKQEKECAPGDTCGVYSTIEAIEALPVLTQLEPDGLDATDVLLGRD